MAAETQKVKRVCKCENCGNEAEMLITCTLDPSHDHDRDGAGKTKAQNGAVKKHVKGKGTCSSCGNEADMWIDL